MDLERSLEAIIIEERLSERARNDHKTTRNKQTSPITNKTIRMNSNLRKVEPLKANRDSNWTLAPLRQSISYAHSAHEHR